MKPDTRDASITHWPIIGAKQLAD